MRNEDWQAVWDDSEPEPAGGLLETLVTMVIVGGWMLALKVIAAVKRWHA